MEKGDVEELVENNDANDPETIMDLLADDRVARDVAFGLDESIMEEAVEERRERSFRVIWESSSASKEEVIEGVKEYEEAAIEADEGLDDDINIPNWILMMQAQDMVMKRLIESFNGGDE